jgi:hypothetical protein
LVARLPRCRSRSNAIPTAIASCIRVRPRGAVPRIRSGKNIFEAFPNAFLGVLLAAEGFDDMPPLRRGAKFDWLFEMCCRATRISDVVDSIGLPEIKEVLPTIETNTETRSESGIGLSAHCCVCCCRTIHSYWRSTRGIFLLAAVECLGRVGAKRDRGSTTPYRFP